MKSNYAKVLESCILVAVTITVFYFAPLLEGSECTLIPQSAYTDESFPADSFKKYQCEEGYYNPLATLLFNR